MTARRHRVSARLVARRTAQAASTAPSPRVGRDALLVLAMLAVILFDVVRGGPPRLSWAFLTEAPREGMTEGGIFPAIYRHGGDGPADDRRGRARGGRDRDLPARVRAAGVAADARWCGSPSPTWRACRRSSSACSAWASSSSSWAAGIDKAFFHGDKVFGQPALLWAALTLAVLTLPVVIVATEEALRAVPRELREASLALGATKFQTVSRRGLRRPRRAS